MQIKHNSKILDDKRTIRIEVIEIVHERNEEKDYYYNYPSMEEILFEIWSCIISISPQSNVRVSSAMVLNMNTVICTYDTPEEAQKALDYMNNVYYYWIKTRKRNK